MEELSFRNKSYKDLTDFIYDLLGNKKKVSAQKDSIFLFLTSKLLDNTFSETEKYHLNFLFGCLHFTLGKPKSAIKLWCCNFKKEDAVAAHEFTKGCKVLTTLPFEYDWDDKSKIRLHLSAISENLKERQSKMDSDSKRDQLQSLEYIVNSVMEQSSKKYKRFVNFEVNKGESEENEVSNENMQKKSTKSETNAAKPDVAAKIAPAQNSQKFNELITNVHFLLGQSRERYGNLMEILANSLFTNGKDSANYDDEQKADLWFLLGCFYFVSSRNKERAMLCWTTMNLKSKRRKRLLEFGFTMLTTLPQKYDWCEHAKANLHLETIIQVMEEFEQQQVLDVFAAKKLKIIHGIAQSVLLTTSSHSYTESFEEFKEYQLRVIPPEQLRIDFVASDAYNEMTEKLYPMLGEPETFGELKSLFQASFRAKDARERLDKFEKCHLSILLGCFYFATDDIDEAILLWLQVYGHHGDRLKNNYIIGIFDSVLKKLKTVPAKNKWNKISQRNLHLKFILQNLSFFQETYAEIDIPHKSSLPPVRALVENALQESTKKYKRDFTKLMDNSNQLEDFQYFDFRLERRPRRICLNKKFSINKLMTNLPLLLSNLMDNVYLIEDMITGVELETLSHLELLFVQFWHGCLCFASQQKYKAIKLWLRVIKHSQTPETEHLFKLVTDWPTEYRWEKKTRASLHLSQILVAINAFRIHCFHASIEGAINTLEMTVKHVYEASSEEYKHLNVVKTLLQPEQTQSS